MKVLLRTADAAWMILAVETYFASSSFLKSYNLINSKSTRKIVYKQVKGDTDNLIQNHKLDFHRMSTGSE